MRRWNIKEVSNLSKAIHPVNCSVGLDLVSKRKAHTHRHAFTQSFTLLIKCNRKQASNTDSKNGKNQNGHLRSHLSPTVVGWFTGQTFSTIPEHRTKEPSFLLFLGSWLNLDTNTRQGDQTKRKCNMLILCAYRCKTLNMIKWKTKGIPAAGLYL